MNNDSLTETAIWTIGHAEHSLERFLSLLSAHQIQMLVDTRSVVYAENCLTQFRRDNLSVSLKAVRISYSIFGEEVLDTAQSDSLHEPVGLYETNNSLPCFQFGGGGFQGWARLEQGVRFRRIALLCSEESPLHCNRRHLVSKPLASKGIKTYHIRGNGSLETEKDLLADEETSVGTDIAVNSGVTEIYTIGVTHHKAEDFFGALRHNKIQRLLDVRLNNWTQLAGFTKRNDLAFFLKELCGAEYVHELLLAPTRALLDSYKKNGGKWESYETEFLALLAERGVERQLDRSLFDRPTVLLCYEAEADFCHRRLVLEYLQAKWGGLKVTHL